MRNRILTNLNIDPFFKPTQFDILILNKLSSIWKHNNFIENLEQVKQWINEEYFDQIGNINIIDPKTVSFQEQMYLITNASIIISLWDGMGFYNFLAPLNTVEIIITNYFKKLGYAAKHTFDKIPDYDMLVRDSVTTQYTLRY